jgi:general secretion pathway protein G
MIHQREKRNFSLSILEIMIVILLISIIGGTIGYNLKGSLDKGKAFKTVQAKEQLHDLLLLCVAEGKTTMEEAAKEPLRFLHMMDLAKKPDELIKDGWGVPFEIKVVSGGADFKLRSKEHEKYLKTHEGKKKEGEKNEEEQEEEL